MDTAQLRSRLLLVDGDPKSLRVLDVSLRKAGFDVTTATSGREALALLETSLPDLIISDTDLHEMDGFELCRQIKARPEWTKIPFLFVSGRKSIEDKIRGLELGVEDYLSKPIYIKEIGVRVRTALQRAERERMESRREGRTRFAGDLSDVGVVDLVQTIELNRKSGIIHIVNRDNRRGSIFFRDGKVIDAEVGRLSGSYALYRLFAWSEGRFAVEFKQIRRHDVIDAPMAPLLMEGMRRLDETTRLLDKLPSVRAVLEVDCRVLAEELAELPDEMNSVLRLCDGTRTLQEVVEDSDQPDLEALTIVSRLFAEEVVFAREAADPGGESEPGERLARWLSEGGAEDGVAAEDTSASSEFLAPTEISEDQDAVPAATPVPTRTRKLPAMAVDEGSAASPAGPAAGTPTVSTQAASAAAPSTATAEDLSLSDALTAGVAAEPERSGAPRAGDTLKGVPLETLFGKAPRAKVAEPPEGSDSAVRADHQRPTKPPGLAERMLSDHPAVRAAAMHEAISDGGGRISGPLATDRNTREYGSPEDSVAALMDEVVSGAHEPKRESPAEPERPSKVVDWGLWPAGLTESAAALGHGMPELPPTPPSAELAPSVELAPPASQAESPGQSPLAPTLEAMETQVAESEVSEALPATAGSGEGKALEAENGEAAGKQIPPFRSASEPTPAPPHDSAAPADSALSAAPRLAGHRQLWILAIGAFAAGALGFLALFGKGTDSGRPGATSLTIVPPAARPNLTTANASLPAGEPRAKSPVPAGKAVLPAAQPSTGLPAAKAVLPAAIAPAVRPNPVAKPKVAGPPDGAPVATTPTASDLRRKCLEVDAGGKGKAKAVASACRPALEADPKDVEVMVILARAELDRGRLWEARSLANRALAIDPKRFDAYIYVGNAAQEAGKIDEARAAYKKYLELAPNGPFARELRAILNNL